MTLDNIDWKDLGFSYIRTDYNYVSYYKDGAWDDGALVKENTINISMSSPALHYGQQAFEGLKAYRTPEDEIQLFRPDENAKRLQRTADRLLMPRVETEQFIDACFRVIKANEAWVPPYDSGATLYIRPYLIGVGDNIGVKPASEYIFGIIVMPVGPYFKGGLEPTAFGTTDYDRAAPSGTGAAKCGGNYAASLLPHAEGAKLGFADVIYLDPATHTKIEEVGSANFFGITGDNSFVTPKSESVLRSITRISLQQLSEQYLDMKVEERDCYIDNLGEFIEAGACGTAAVITPIASITHHGNKHVFYSETEVSPTVQKLYDLLVGIQKGEIEGPEGWIYKLSDHKFAE